MWEFGRITLGGPESSIFDLPNIQRGFRCSLDAMWTEVSGLNLNQAIPSLRMHAFFVLGRRDHQVPADTSAAYFNVLTAPSKRPIWFGESGHEPSVDESAKFNAAMVELVCPVSV